MSAIRRLNDFKIGPHTAEVAHSSKFLRFVVQPVAMQLAFYELLYWVPFIAHSNHDDTATWGACTGWTMLVMLLSSGRCGCGLWSHACGSFEIFFDMCLHLLEASNGNKYKTASNLSPVPNHKTFNAFLNQNKQSRLNRTYCLKSRPQLAISKKTFNMWP